MQRHGVSHGHAARPDRERGRRRRLRRSGAAGRRPADRGRARHRQLGRARHDRAADLADAVDAELERQLADLPDARAEAARASLGAERWLRAGRRPRRRRPTSPTRTRPSTSRSPSPTARSIEVVDGLVNAGEILVGQHTPFSAANFVIGCPASLPTSGFAHVSSGITAATFLKRTAVARADETALRSDGAFGDRARRPRGVPRPRGRVSSPSRAEPAPCSGRVMARLSDRAWQSA